MRSKRVLDDAFRARDLRRTPQRYAVLDFLLRHPMHPTADDIYHAINRSDPRASRATVYNNLHTLVAAGLVREFALEGSRSTRYDANTGRHHHFVCEACGRVEDVEGLALPGLPRRALPGGRVVRSYDVVFHGLCAVCAKTCNRGGGPDHRKQ